MAGKTRVRIVIGIVFAIVIAGAGAFIFLRKTATPSQSPGPRASAPPAASGSTSESVSGATLVALGSSFTRATNLASDMRGENDDYSFSTGLRISSVFGFLKKETPGLAAVNLASPGAEMRDILERQLPEALKAQPTYVTIDPGADIVSGNSLPAYKKNLAAILERIGTEPLVMLFTYPDFSALRTASFPSCRENVVGVHLENASEENILAYNGAIRELAQDRSNVILLDIYSTLGPEHVSDYDCLHFNVRGQEAIAEGFIHRLQEDL